MPSDKIYSIKTPFLSKMAAFMNYIENFFKKHKHFFAWIVLSRKRIYF